MAPRRWLRRLALGALALGLLLAAGLLAAGQLGLLQGQPPTDLGVHQGRLKAPAVTPNSVSSQARLHAGHPMQEAAMIAPLQVPGSPAEAIERITRVVQTMPGAAIVTRHDDYLYVRFTTRWLKFVDDTEFWADGSGVVQVRSASRLGDSDLGVNRARIEHIRSRLPGDPAAATLRRFDAAPTASAAASWPARRAPAPGARAGVPALDTPTHPPAFSWAAASV